MPLDHHISPQQLDAPFAPSDMNAPTPPAVCAPSSTLFLLPPSPSPHQHIFACPLPTQLHHGQTVHIIASRGQIFTSTLVQLSLNGSHFLEEQGGEVEVREEERRREDGTTLPPRSNSAHKDSSPSSAPPVNTNFYLPQQPTCPNQSATETTPPSESVGSVIVKEENGDADEHQLPISLLTFPSSKLRTSDHSPELNVDGINLEEIKDFAKSFKMKRLSLGLTQTQVGQALSLTEGPAYSQSAICRFEKLDITPKSAQKIKPVLEKWMGEIDEKIQQGQLTPGLEGPPPLDSLHPFPPAAPLSPSSLPPPASSVTALGMDGLRKRKRRTSFTPQALELLNQFFQRNTHPSGSEMTALAESLGYDREVVRVWFCNKRQALKNTIKKFKLDRNDLTA